MDHGSCPYMYLVSVLFISSIPHLPYIFSKCFCTCNYYALHACMIKVKYNKLFSNNVLFKACLLSRNFLKEFKGHRHSGIAMGGPGGARLHLIVLVPRLSF